jgi:hypothetical protein
MRFLNTGNKAKNMANKAIKKINLMHNDEKSTCQLRRRPTKGTK